MIAYRTLNEYLNNIELPLSIEEILDYKHSLEGKDLVFINCANRFISEFAEHDKYREKDVHCIGTCLTNLTRVGMYFLLEDEIVTVCTSNLRPVTEESEWEATHYPFKEIQELNLQLKAYTNEPSYEGGMLYIKAINEKDQERTHILRNLNPKHFQYFKDFHTNMRENRNITD